MVFAAGEAAFAVEVGGETSCAPAVAIRTIRTTTIAARRNVKPFRIVMTTQSKCFQPFAACVVADALFRPPLTTAKTCVPSFFNPRYM